MGEVNGDYEQVPYTTIQKFDDYEERMYPSVKWACTEMTYERNEEDPAEEEGGNQWSIIKMMQEMMSQKSWKNRPSSKMFMKLFRYISGVNQQSEEIEMTVPVLTRMTVFVHTFGGYAMRDKVWINEAQTFADKLSTRADSIDFSKFYTAGYDSPMKFWNRRNEVMFLVNTNEV